ncbi:uncharacterized protein LOC122405215 isoform X1 [Colletes gigas]|uniref:uncharacterized protein LOC122405215 isoform X1 n=1 Tax=Colletes gigas TaxID=935657 RepID=UPI001C9B1B8B|nr:uncharacterized protein LOC122405215 isoform X1 [Colletes gigas]
MAAFWFLDTLALHVLRQKQKLDDYYLSVLISWLAGEMTLIRDRKLSREEFLEEMKNIFKTVAIRVSEENRVPYWDEIVCDNDTEATEHSVDNLLPAQMESNQQVSTKNLQKKQPKEYEDASLSMSEETNKSSSNVDPVVALDIVIESTYNMYANEFRYSLVYAVYVEPIEMETRQLPFSLEKPRSVKLVDPNSMPFNVQLKKLFATMKQTRKKATGRGRKKGSKVPETPPPSLTEEEELIRKRRFILPLIEAENALEVIEKHKDEA